MKPSPQTPKPLADVRALVLFGGSKLFGSERANIEVLRNLAEQGAEVRFITNNKWGHEEIEPALAALGFGWMRAPFGYHWGKYLFSRHFYYIFFNLYGVVVTSWRVWRETRRWRATHLFAGNWEFFSYALPAVLCLKLPLVYRAGDELPVHTWFHRWVTRRLVRHTESLVCVSKFILERCVAAGAPRERARVIYSYPPARKRLNDAFIPELPAGATVMSYVGQIAEHKGVLVLMDAVEEMIRRGDNVALLLAGEASWGDELLAALKARVAAPPLRSRIFFLGYVRDAFAVLERGDIHVCPSLFAEPLANVVNEAKLCARPSVVFPMGGLPEIIEHGVDGFVCRDCGAAALREGIEFFAADVEKRKAAGAAARRSLEARYGLERFREEWKTVFLQRDGHGK